MGWSGTAGWSNRGWSLLALAAPSFFASVNMSGLEGGSVIPGTQGTDYFGTASGDLAYIAARAHGPIRIPFLWERLQPTLNGALDTTYLSYLKASADQALATGQTVFFDCHNYMHRLVNGTGYYVDASDGNVTRAHLANLWSRIATYFASHAGVYGYDIMNEPQGGFGTTGNAQTDLPVIMQASVNAINAVDATKKIFVEGNYYSSVSQWVSGNTGYPLVDLYRQIIYSAHNYPDYDGSGTHFDWATFQSNSEALTVLSDRSAGFIGWARSNNVKIHIGETNVGIDNTGWLTVLYNGLSACKAANDVMVGVNLWLYSESHGGDPDNMVSYTPNATQAPQWAVVQQVLGLPIAGILISGPSNATTGTASSAYTINVGFLASSMVVTPSDGGHGGAFSPATLTLAAGYNSTGTFTYTGASAGTINISASGGGFTSVALPLAVASASAFVPTNLSEVKRYYTAGNSSTVTASGGRVNNVTDLAGSGKPLTDMGSYSGPSLVTNSTFGGTKAAFHGDGNASGTGQYGRLGVDISDLTGSTQFAVFMTASMIAGGSYARLLSIANGSSGTDYTTTGAMIFCGNGSSEAYILAAQGTLTSAFDPGAFSTPTLLEAVFDGTNATFWANGVSVQSYGYTSGLTANAFLRLFCDQSQSELFDGEARSIVVTSGAVSTSDRQKIEGFLSWDAVGSGALLPTGHPYKSAAP